VLRATLDEAEAAIGDAPTYAALARRFHTEVVACCGNETMILVVGALESLWSAHVAQHSRRASLGAFEDEKRRRATVREHERIYKAIERGDAREARRAAMAHYSSPHDRTGTGTTAYAFDLSTVVDAALVRDV
jgi:DNA-binding FadR family transcriptional regulator